ncbi:hypothetical protein AZE42_07070 [Rhizopogon vesiculosus]|uniref:Uncharacterized protein n=1 Tax=Rhizopogon vesiculosus TaxID=180088 RepID=A0A1J8QFS4_9AGAM|nr:hypothetical protein AZE42_07070 [Rhizopogon vesiculosus]
MLPVTVEESKAQRIQRQQARFRDRGGSGSLLTYTVIELTPVDPYSAFVPSEKNPLVDILLSRTISGESPSKLATKSPYRHRSRSISPSKANHNKKVNKPQESPPKVKNLRSNTNIEAQAGSPSGNAVAGPSTESGGKTAKTETKKKVGPVRKGKGKAKTHDDEVPAAEKPKAKPAPKRKGRPPKTQATDIDAVPEPPKRKAKISKAKASDKLKTKDKLAEAPQSDDEGTLVEAPRLKAQSRRKPVMVTINSDDEDDAIPDDKIANAEPPLTLKSGYKRSTKAAPLNRVQAKQRTEVRKDEDESNEAEIEASQTRKHSKRAEAEEESLNAVKSKTHGSMTVEVPTRKSVASSKRRASDGEDAEQPTKRAKVIKLQSAKSLPLSNSIAISKPSADDPAVKKPSSAMKKDTKRKKDRPPESDDEDHLPKKPAPKRARFVEEAKPLVHISSKKQKENTVPRKTRTRKPISKPKSRGPPQDVIDRIKASATVQVDDGDPDPLDCLA